MEDTGLINTIITENYPPPQKKKIKTKFNVILGLNPKFLGPIPKKKN